MSVESQIEHRFRGGESTPRSVEPRRRDTGLGLRDEVALERVHRPGGPFKIGIALAAIFVLALATLFAAADASANPRLSRVQSPVDPDLTKLHDLYLAAGTPVDPFTRNEAPSPFAVSDAGFLDSAQVVGGLVLIEAAAEDAEAILLTLESLGFAEGVAFGRSISGYLPISAIPALETIEGLVAIRLARAEVSTGSVAGQGDSGMRADLARAAHGVDGSGVTVGIISDSYDCLGGAAADVASGDLPSGVVVLQELTPCTSGTDEGRAMAQLVHDVAPGAAIMFQTGFLGPASMAQGIIDLQAAGADVIVDDIGYLTQPFFQDGVIAQAVDTVVAAGTAYFSAAGNEASQSYESSYRSGTTYGFGAFPSASGAPTFFGGTAHDFDPGAGVSNFQRITIPAGATTKITVQWDEPAFSVSGGSGSTNEVDAYLFDDAMSTVLLGSANLSRGGDPVEFISGTNVSGSPLTLRLGIFYDGSVGGAAPGLVKYIHFDSITVDEFATSSSTVFGHPNAAGAGVVGAASYASTPAFGTSPPVAESFTSLGGTTILFDTSGNPVSIDRQKPDFTGVDDADTTFFGSDTDGNGLPNFFGTSAAAPHAAAVAALMLDEDPSLSPAGVYSILETTAVDMNTGGWDALTGYGLIDANAALSAVGTPVVSAGSDVTSNEGATVNLSPASFTDPDSSDTHTATIDWGDGSPVEVGTVDQSAKTVSGSHIYIDNGAFTVTVTVTDDDGSVGSDTLLVTVNNGAPTVSAGSDQAIARLASFNLSPSTFSDVGTSDTHTATIDWGDGSSVATGVVDQAANTVSGAHTYTASGTFTVTVTVTDDDGGVGSDTMTVTVTNNAPVVSAGADQTLNAGATFNLAPATFTDIEAGDTHTATIDWGDGSPVATGTIDQSAHTVSGSHAYTSSGVFTVTVTVSDGDKTGSDTLTVTAISLPGAPRNVVASEGDEQAPVVWDAPKNDGSSPITGYEVTASPGGATVSVAGTVTSATVTGLTNGTDYTFTVTATNSVGTGPASSVSNTVTPQLPPSIGVSLTSIEATVGAYSVTSTTITISNSGPGALRWTATGQRGTITAIGGGSPASPTGFDALASDLFWADAAAHDIGMYQFSSGLTGDGPSSFPDEFNGDSQGLAVNNGLLYFISSGGQNEVFVFGTAGIAPGSSGSGGPSSFSLPSGTYDGLAFDSGLLYALDAQNDRIVTVDPSTTSVLRVVDIATPVGGGLAPGPDNDLYVVTASNTVAQVDPILGTVVASVYTQTDPIAGLAFDGTYLYVGTSSTVGSPIHRIVDPATGTVVTTLTTLRRVSGLAVNQRPHFVSINNGGGTIDPGASKDITVTLQAQSIKTGGSYAGGFTYGASVSISSNDPSVSTVKVPITLTVPDNGKPVVNAGPDVSITEGDSVSLASVSFTDEADDSHKATVQWNDGTSPAVVTVPVDQPSDSVSGTHEYLDDGTYLVSVGVADQLGNAGSDGFEVTVANAVPMVDAGPDVQITPGSTFNLAGTYTDAGKADTHDQIRVWWGDGLGYSNSPGILITGSAGSGSFSGSSRVYGDRRARRHGASRG